MEQFLLQRAADQEPDLSLLQARPLRLHAGVCLGCLGSLAVSAIARLVLLAVSDVIYSG